MSFFYLSIKNIGVLNSIRLEDTECQRYMLIYSCIQLGNVDS